jgi:hypothetical protein
LVFIGEFLVRGSMRDESSAILADQVRPPPMEASAVEFVVHGVDLELVQRRSYTARRWLEPGSGRLPRRSNERDTRRRVGGAVLPLAHLRGASNRRGRRDGRRENGRNRDRGGEKHRGDDGG